MESHLPEIRKDLSQDFETLTQHIFALHVRNDAILRRKRRSPARKSTSNLGAHPLRGPAPHRRAVALQIAGLVAQGAMTRVNLEQLRTFLAVVRLGGVRKAASVLNITQPAVTARIKALEETLGCALYDRTSRGIRLTKRGELLVAHAEKLEHLVELVERDVVDPAGVDRRLRLGVSETIAQCWLPDLVAGLHATYPQLEIDINVDISPNLREALLARDLDLAILLGPISEHTVDNVALPGFDLAWYISAAEAPRADPVEHLSRPVLTYARNTRPYRELRELLFERVGPDVSLFPSTSLSACFRLVAANLGVAALPRALGEEHVAAGQIREFDPGWVPSPLNFTASYLGLPKSHVVETAASLAREIALAHRDGGARKL